MFDINGPCSFCPAKAVYYILDVITGTKKEWYLCSACMEKYDKSGYLKMFAVPLEHKLPPPPKPIDTECSKCGMTLSKFMRTKRVGCDQDYDLFQLGPTLKEYHGSDQHIGKVPQGQQLPPEAISNRLDNLKIAMSEAISAEKYEDAAKLRDEIKSLQKDLE